jgi:hypothetical protein
MMEKQSDDTYGGTHELLRVESIETGAASLEVAVKGLRAL